MGDDDAHNLRHLRHHTRLQRFQTNQRKFAEIALDSVLIVLTHDCHCEQLRDRRMERVQCDLRQRNPDAESELRDFHAHQPHDGHTS